jgi:hypothetical protein
MKSENFNEPPMPNVGNVDVEKLNDLFDAERMGVLSVDPSVREEYEKLAQGELVYSKFKNPGFKGMTESGGEYRQILKHEDKPYILRDGYKPDMPGEYREDVKERQFRNHEILIAKKGWTNYLNYLVKKQRILKSDADLHDDEVMILQYKFL